VLIVTLIVFGAPEIIKKTRFTRWLTRKNHKL
jgi:hypothetical protein